jgi:hypothetical protein
MSQIRVDTFRQTGHTTLFSTHLWSEESPKEEIARQVTIVGPTLLMIQFPALQNVLSTRNRYYKKRTRPLYHSCYSYHLHRTDNCLVTPTTNLVMCCVTRVNLSQSNGGKVTHPPVNRT